jgi:hypothetical protein
MVYQQRTEKRGKSDDFKQGGMGAETGAERQCAAQLTRSNRFLFKDSF